jgi:hypothetical protein
MAGIFVGVTDRGWYEHLRALPSPDEGGCSRSAGRAVVSYACS